MQGFAGNMTSAGNHPSVSRVSETDSKRRRSKEEMKILEKRLVRSASVPKGFVTIAPANPGPIILP